MSVDAAAERMGIPREQVVVLARVGYLVSPQMSSGEMRIGRASVRAFMQPVERDPRDWDGNPDTLLREQGADDGEA